MLKSVFRTGRRAIAPRKVLVVVQFMLSVALIICTFVIYRQVNYGKDRPMGYSREGLLLIPKKTDEFTGKYDVLRSELKNTGVVDEIAESNSPVMFTNMVNGGFDWRGKSTEMNASFATLSVTPEYGKTVGWQFIAGRDFSRAFPSDSSGLVVNEAAVRYMGLQNRNRSVGVGGPPIGQLIQWDPKWRKPQTFTIIGVIKDMVVESPFAATQPSVYFLYDYHKWINIRLNPRVSAQQALPAIEAVFKKLFPNSPFDYQFADQAYGLKFATDERMGQLVGFFATLAIIISCLGLFGLASFVAEQRTKEIGVRKVLGASVVSLWRMLSKEFLVLVLIAFILVSPISWYFLTGWLQTYPYHMELSWWIFAFSGAGALALSLLTVSYQALKAALVNPAKSLRSE